MKEQSHTQAVEMAESVLQQKNYEQMTSLLQTINHHSSTTFRHVLEQLKTLLILQPERIYTHHTNLTIDMLQIVRDIFKAEHNLDQKYFEVHSGYMLMAVTEGFLLQNLPQEKLSKIKQILARKLQKGTGLWGLEQLESLQAYLIDKSTGYVPNPSPIHHEREIDKFHYFLSFYEDFGFVFPQMTDAYSILFKMMLCLREEGEKDRSLLVKLRQKYFSNRYHIQTTTKNMKFVLQFFKHSFSQKQCRYYPQKTFQSILANYTGQEIEGMLMTTSTGVIWQQLQIYEYFLNCIRLGFSQVSKKMMIAMIKLAERTGKFAQLCYCYESNIKRVFIFMKYPKFYAICLEILKYFIHSPPPTLSLYEKFLPEAVIFMSKAAPQQRSSFLNLLQVVAFVYKQSAPVEELNHLILANLQNQQSRLSEQQMKKMLEEYCWKDRLNIKSVGLSQSVAVNRPKSGYKGLTNIGNSCYMNSFLQSLFMNREFLRYIIKSSTLEIRTEKLKDKRLQGKQRQFIEKQIQNCVKPFAQLQKTFALLLKSIRNDISPANIRQVAPEMFRNSSQHDTIQFGRQFLDLIFRNNIPAMFEGQVTTEILCKECSKIRQRKQAFLDYHVSAQCGQLQQLIRNSFSEEIVKDLTCDHCQRKGEESIKHHFISKFPNYLIISINRFEYDVVEKRNLKNKAKIVINPLLTINEISYQIYSIIIHTGPSSNAGHYFAFSKTSSQPNCKWVCHNDSHVSQFQNFNQVTNFLDNSLEDTPYIIFYQNVQHIEKNKEMLSQPIILREPQDKFVKKDNETYLSSQKKTPFQLKPVNFNFFMKNEDDEDNNGPGNGGGFYNSYVA